MTAKLFLELLGGGSVCFSSSSSNRAPSELEPDLPILRVGAFVDRHCFMFSLDFATSHSRSSLSWKRQALPIFAPGIIRADARERIVLGRKRSSSAALSTSRISPLNSDSTKAA